MMIRRRRRRRRRGLLGWGIGKGGRCGGKDYYMGFGRVKLGCVWNILFGFVYILWFGVGLFSGQNMTTAVRR